MWTLFIVFLSSGWNEPVKYKEVNRFETFEECELRIRVLAAKSLDTPSTALNPQDLRTEVPVPMMYACVLG
jgi:hypothetical protein